MKYIDHSSDDVRQIVPGDMSFLSDADQEVVEAMGGMLCSLFGVTEKMAVVMKGMRASLVLRETPAVGSMMTIEGGVVLHGGKLYTFSGGSVEGQSRILEGYASNYALLFTESDVVNPSPVYGETIAFTETPHKEMRAVLVAKASIDESNDDYVLLKDVKVMPQIATPNSITSSRLVELNTAEA